MINSLKNVSFLRFLLVGIINTIIGTTLMFTFYEILVLGYWLSSAIAYIIAGLASYFLNKKFTFKSDTKNTSGMIKFIILLCICYFIAYTIAKPFTFFVLSNSSLSIKDIEQIAMLVGMFFYSLLNYFGQKIWVFN